MSESIWTDNRVILCHFDSYSTALVFARFGTSVLAPEALPEGAEPMAPPTTVGPQHDPDTVFSALTERYGFAGSDWERVVDFDEWMAVKQSPIRIHLARSTAFEAPRTAIEPFDGVFKPISELRGTAPSELNLVRRVFNLIMGGR